MLQASERQDLSRRFTEGYKRILAIYGEDNLPAQWIDLRSRLLHYQSELKDSGLRDYQVTPLIVEHLDEDIAVEQVDSDFVLSWLRIVYQIFHTLFLLLVAGLPILLLHLPVAFLSGVYAERKRKKALAKSKVKIRGFDVSRNYLQEFAL